MGLFDRLRRWEPVEVEMCRCEHLVEFHADEGPCQVAGCDCRALVVWIEDLDCGCG